MRQVSLTRAVPTTQLASRAALAPGRDGVATSPGADAARLAKRFAHDARTAPSKTSTPPFATQLVVCLCLIVSHVSVGAAAADDGPQPQSHPFIVRDIGVYLLSAYGSKLNDRDLFRSTLPGFTLPRRPTAARDASNVPSPVNIITFEGPTADDVDVLLELESGRFLAHWPAAGTRAKRVLWQRLKLTKDLPTTLKLPVDHWLTPLRSADRLFVQTDQNAERFALYDVELDLTPRLTVSLAESGFRLQNAGQFPIHDVTVFKPGGQNAWKTAYVERIDGTGVPEKPSATDGTPKSPSPEAVFDEKPAPKPAEAQDGQSAPKDPAKAQPAAAASDNSQPAKPEPTPNAETSNATTTEKPKDASPVGIEALLAKEPTAGVQATLEPWRQRLQRLRLGAAEIDHVLAILEQHALKPDKAMVVYRLDEEQLEKLLPLEVTPPPDVQIRVALVILQDADPEVLTSIDRLIAELGDPVWKKRAAAQKELEKLGRAALPKLQEALKHQDAEIVYRAEQLLEAVAGQASSVESPLVEE